MNSNQKHRSSKSIIVPVLAVFFSFAIHLSSCSSTTTSLFSNYFNDSVTSTSKQYYPNWKSLDSRPLPTWYDEAKIGIFLHWGVFSVPSFVDAWFWYWWKGPDPRPEFVEFMKKNYRPDFTYQDFAAEFTTEFFNPLQWAEIFKSSGARYVVLTTKHHEGFCLWPTKHSWNWNAMDVGPKRDLVGELADAIRSSTDLKFGVYHSLYEFFNPLLLRDHAHNFTTQDFVRTKAMPELYELVNTYKPDLVWSDGQWKGEDTYWNSTNFLAWLYNESPVKDTVVTNDRWGRHTVCKHGGYLTCKDHFNPKKLWPRKFEDSTTMTKRGWSFQRNLNLSDVHDMYKITELIAQVVSCGGNLLINVGPTKEGIIVPIFEERLRQMGEWLGINGEGIYGTRPWSHQREANNKNVWYTKRDGQEGRTVYAVLLKWPEESTLELPAVRPDHEKTQVSMLGSSIQFMWQPLTKDGGIIINIPVINFSEMPSQWAWVLKLTNIHN